MTTPIAYQLHIPGRGYIDCEQHAHEAERARGGLVRELVDARAAQAQIDKLRRCLGFFASVIKSGESWTDTCEQEYRAALLQDHTP